MYIDNWDNMATLMHRPCAEFAIHLSPFIETRNPSKKLFEYNATSIKPLHTVECSILERIKMLASVIESRMND